MKLDPKKLRIQKCSDCRFFLFDDDEPEKGECRKFPPQLFSSTQGDASDIFTQFCSYWPDVDPEEWCGQWEELK